MKKVVIFGAAGHTGKYLTRKMQSIADIECRQLRRYHAAALSWYPGRGRGDLPPDAGGRNARLLGGGPCRHRPVHGGHDR